LLFQGRFLLPLLYSLSSVQKTIILKVKPWLLHNNYISSPLASVLPSLFDLLVSLHLCFFYIAGGYPDLVKRILRIRYVRYDPCLPPYLCILFCVLELFIGHYLLIDSPTWGSELWGSDIQVLILVYHHISAFFLVFCIFKYSCF